MIAKSTFELLEFDRLLEKVCTAAHSEVSKKAVLEIAPLTRGEDIRLRFDQVEDILRIFQTGSSLQLQPFEDIMPLLGRVRPAGSVLEARDLSAFVPVLDMSIELASRMSQMEGLKALPGLIGRLTGQPDLLTAIQRSIGPDGTIRDSASAALSNIRRELRVLDLGIRKRLEEMMREQAVAVFLQDDFITKRAGRWVIPVRMDSKGQVPGVVHDISKSGETAFIEPLSIIRLSNELENLSAEEKAEELRILRSLSSGVRDRAGEIEEEFSVLVFLDMLNCVARFADQHHMEVPEVAETAGIRLVNARHPLLEIAFEKMGGGREVVPLDLQLGGENTVMVITGSNAGGKTISLKTVGLLTCMALSGMPVPAHSSSSFPLISSLLVDIGDEQSIENNLSTFAAHVMNMARILDIADGRTLVLMDELGTGTDPEEGSAIACAVLKELQQKGSLVFATTHLMGIKGFVQRTPGMVNASMAFDKKTFSPLYRLRAGEPGQSHALEIAAKYGLPSHLVMTAKEMLGGSAAELENLMADLNEKRADYERLLSEVIKTEADLRARERHAEQKVLEAEKKVREILAGAHRESLEIVAGTKRQMRSELAEIRLREKREIQEKIKQLEEKQKQISETLVQYEQDDGRALSISDVHVGDTVFLKSLGYDGTVMAVLAKANRVKVIAGSKEILVSISDIRSKQGKGVSEKTGTTLTRTSSEETAPSRINLIGMRMDEALSLLEPFLNHAALAGLQEVTIIHGVGAGILQRAVREHLDGHPLVRKFRTGEPSEGGAGVTVVTLV